MSISAGDRARGPARSTDQTQPSSTGATATTTAARPQRPRSLLIVDDDTELLHRIGQRLLWHFGDTLQTLRCSCPQRALQHLRSARVDVVLSALTMAGIDGVTLLAATRLAQPRAVRMMLLTRAEMLRVVDDRRQVDVFRYVAKPWDAEQLVTHVQAALDEAERRRAEFGWLRSALGQPARAAGAMPVAAAASTSTAAWPADALTLPAQLLTMPGDLWAPAPAAGPAASRSRR